MLLQNGKTVQLEQGCDFGSLTDNLDKSMAMAISTFSLDAANNPLTDQCTEVCSSGSTMISGLQWTEGPDNGDDSDDDGTSGDDSGDDDTEVLVWGDAAPSLTEGECASTNCSECR